MKRTRDKVSEENNAMEENTESQEVFEIITPVEKEETLNEVKPSEQPQEEVSKLPKINITRNRV